MNNLLETFEKKQIEKLTDKKRIPRFRAGDTLKVIVKITEGISLVIWQTERKLKPKRKLIQKAKRKAQWMV